MIKIHFKRHYRFKKDFEDKKWKAIFYIAAEKERKEKMRRRI